MSGTVTVEVGDRGRVVIPAELRQRLKWAKGSTLIAVETPHGVLLTERSELESIVRQQLAGRDLVADLLEDRRAAATAEDAL